MYYFSLILQAIMFKVNTPEIFQSLKKNNTGNIRLVVKKKKSQRNYMQRTFDSFRKQYKFE